MSQQIKRRRKGELAKRGLEKIFSDVHNQLYTGSDVEIAKEFNVSRLTVFNIRKELSVKSRNERIVEVLKNIDTSALTLRELAIYTGVQYQNLYKIVKGLKLKTKADVRPIEHMIQHQRLKQPRKA